MFDPSDLFDLSHTEAKSYLEGFEYPWEALGAKWGTPGSWEAQSKAVAVALNQKVVDKFFKGLRRGGGSSPGLSAAASCKPSPSSGGRPLSPSFFFFLQWQKNAKGICLSVPSK